MSHDTTKQVMGSVNSNHKEVSNWAGSSTTFPAGQAVRLKSDGTLSKAKADGQLLGISLGKDLSNAGRVPVVRKGLSVPILLKASFDPAIGAQVLLDDTTGLATGDGTNTGVNAVYASGRLGGTGVTGGYSEGGSSADTGVALIDFPGGL